jgi:hypothetical protein
MRYALPLLVLLCCSSAPAQKAVLTAVTHDQVTVFSTAGSEYDTAKWAIHPPEARPFLWDRERDGQQEAICFFKGRYTVVFAALKAGALDIAIHHSDGEKPPPGPTPPPKPPPTPPGPTDDLAAWTTQSVEQHVPVAHRGDGAKIADAIQEVINKKSSYKTARAYREAVRQHTHAALRAGSPTDVAWTAWSDDHLEPRLEKEIEAGRLTTIEQYVQVGTAVVRGLRAVKVPRAAAPRPTIYIITTTNCEPCTRLKNDYLPWAKSQGRFAGCQIAYLDRWRDEELVTRFAKKGMKGRIVVPQIVIRREIDGKRWVWQFTGYINRATTDRLVRNALAWEGE